MGDDTFYSSAFTTLNYTNLSTEETPTYSEEFASEYVDTLEEMFSSVLQYSGKYMTGSYQTAE